MLAAIDLGSNSFRLHVGYYELGKMNVVCSSREHTRLASRLNAEGVLNDEAFRRGVEALQRLSQVLKQYSINKVRAVATNTLRIAANAEEFLPQAENALGYPIEVIPGLEEARLIYMGLAYQLKFPEEQRLVVDIGGGSTEVILGYGNKIEKADSLSIGTFLQSFDFFPEGRITKEFFDDAIISARNRFKEVKSFTSDSSINQAYGSSGTIRALSEVISQGVFELKTMDLELLYNLRDLMVERGRFDALVFEKVRPERISSLVGGLAILIGFMQELNIKQIIPVQGGLRLGVMWDLYLSK